MKLLVTGATGFLGQEVVSQLLARGHEVVAVARGIDAARRMPWFERVRFVAADIHADAAFTTDLAARTDALVHLAWPNVQRPCLPAHFESTLPADYRFLTSAVEAGIKHVLVSGSCLEYGLRDGGIVEDSATDPITAYGLAKDALHRFLRQFQSQCSFTLQWTRLFYIYGPGQPSGTLIGQLDKVIREGGKTFDMSSGEQLRDYQSVDRAAHQLCTLVEHPEVSGAINCCSGVPTSVRRLVEERIAASGRSISLNLGVLPYRDFEPKAFWGVVGKLRPLLIRSAQ